MFRWLRRLLLLIFLVVLALSIPIVWMGHRDRIGHADFAVVPGARVYQNGSPGTALRARLDKTVALYRAGWFSRILVSGGLGKEGHNEAFVMKQYLQQQGIPATDILVDPEGNDTAQTAQHTAAIAAAHGWHSVLVVSQYFHVPRCQLALRRFGVDSVFHAHASAYFWRDLYSIPRESLAMLYYWVFVTGAKP